MKMCSNAPKGKKMLKIFLVASLSAMAATVAQAASCDDYGLTQGMTIEDVQGGIKILATASVGVSFDDVDAVNDARDEATMAAKALIASFMSEGIRSDDQISRAVHEDKSLQADARRAKRIEIIDRVRHLANSSSALLRGVVPLGDCYTPGREMRVTVGIKPETIAAAGGLSNSVAQQPIAQPAPPAPALDSSTPPQSGGTVGGQPLNHVSGFSNNQRIGKF